MSCYGTNPNCCEESNPNCCEICNCLDFTSSNNTLDIQKTGCKTDIRITNNILDGLISIPSSSCITIVKQYVGGKLIFTPTLNLDCVAALIPTIPTIPDVPVYTANSGLKMTGTNTQLGGGDTTPLLQNTEIALGTPTAPNNLRIYQNDSSNSKPVIEELIGLYNGSNINTTKIKSGILATDNLISISKTPTNTNTVISTVKNAETDIAFLAPAYFNLDNTASIFGVNYPITLNNVTNTAPVEDAETTAYCKAYPANYEISAKNVAISSKSTTNAFVELAVPNNYVTLTSVANVPIYGNYAYPIDTAANNMAMHELSPGNSIIEVANYNDRLQGGYLAKQQLLLSKDYSLLGSVIPNTTSTSVSAPAKVPDTTAYAKTYSANVEIYGKNITLTNDSATSAAINQLIPGGSLVYSSTNGRAKWSNYIQAIDSTYNSTLLYVPPGLVDFENFFDLERNTGSFYASTLISGDARNPATPYTQMGVYCPNSIDAVNYPPPAIDLTKTAYTKHAKALIVQVAKEVVTNGKVIVADLAAPPLDAGSTKPCAALEVSSTTGGLLLPRMTSANRLAISGPVAGLKVYDTDFNAEMIYNGSIWTGFRYNSTALKFEGYDGTTWVALN